MARAAVFKVYMEGNRQKDKLSEADSLGRERRKQTRTERKRQ